ncbi:hypothetical protein PR048_031962 [Dryococelus australis]|uniref:Uncharacterized protein n=1 Tax=Dryococelus australis TaxID=614101 RepID=A0ABQ9G9N5_9NEOP|nr:hypothetical protein PR048_031962 [Dryococelus australis]
MIQMRLYFFRLIMEEHAPINFQVGADNKNTVRTDSGLLTTVMITFHSQCTTLTKILSMNLCFWKLHHLLENFTANIVEA